MTNIDIDNSSPGQPVWRLATKYPGQGSWTEADYFELESSDGPLVEFDNGFVEVHDMPSKAHQRIVLFVYRSMHDFVVAGGLGEVLIAPLPVKLWDAKYREPDVIFLASGRPGEKYPQGADLVVEIVSPGTVARQRDLTFKLDEYARAGIAEYWIVDAEEHRVLFCCLQGIEYLVRECQRGETVKSKLLEGFELQVNAILDAAASNRAAAPRDNYED